MSTVFTNGLRESWVESYQRLKKWYLIPPYLTLGIIRYRSRVKWSNPRKGVAPFPTPRCSSYWKGSLWVTLDCCHQLIHSKQMLLGIIYYQTLQYWNSVTKYKYPGYDIKLHSSFGFWGMLNTVSLPLLSGPLWPGVVVPDRVPSMDQTELFNLLLGISYLKPYNCVQLF